MVLSFFLVEQNRKRGTFHWICHQNLIMIWQKRIWESDHFHRHQITNMMIVIICVCALDCVYECMRFIRDIKWRLTTSAPQTSSWILSKKPSLSRKRKSCNIFASTFSFVFYASKSGKWKCDQKRWRGRHTLGIRGKPGMKAREREKIMHVCNL